MPRRTHPLHPGRYYHLYNRGNDRGRIFFEDENYLFFLRKVHQYLRPVFDIVAYCLMPTHYHFLVKVRRSENNKTSEVSDLGGLPIRCLKSNDAFFSLVYQGHK